MLKCLLLLPIFWWYWWITSCPSYPLLIDICGAWSWSLLSSAQFIWVTKLLWTTKTTELSQTFIGDNNSNKQWKVLVRCSDFEFECHASSWNFMKLSPSFWTCKAVSSKLWMNFSLHIRTTLPVTEIDFPSVTVCRQGKLRIIIFLQNKSWPQARHQHGGCAGGPGAGLPGLAGADWLRPETEEEISRDESAGVHDGEVRWGSV